jgi:hypothetical protein
MLIDPVPAIFVALTVLKDEASVVKPLVTLPK